MPAVVIHGTNTRSRTWAHDSGLCDNLQRYVAPVLRKGAEFHIYPVYWGDLGAQFRWDRRSMPGDEDQLYGFSVAGELKHEPGAEVRTRLVLTEPPAVRERAFALSEPEPGAAQRPIGAIGERELVERFETALFARKGDAQPDVTFANALSVVRAAGHEMYDSSAVRMSLTYHAIEVRAVQLAQRSRLPIGQWLHAISDVILAAIGRAHAGDGDEIARALAEFRRPMNDIGSTILGDIITYSSGRGTAEAPGDILKPLLAELTKAAAEKAATGEPLLVVSHSLGGQMVYDVATSVLGKHPQYRDITIDYWCAAASQIGIYEELKQFWFHDEQYSKKTGVPTPSPPVGHWINVWDPTDVFSFTAKPIFDNRVIDVAFVSGWAPPKSHQGYFSLRGFSERLARTIQSPSAATWDNA